jgi:hypothetical protein
MTESMERPDWRRSGRCGSSACVEVAKVGDHYLVRNSTTTQATPLSFTEGEWTAFTGGVKAGDFDWD